MTIPNPLVITVNAVAKNLPRIRTDDYMSEYYLDDTTQTFRIIIRHAKMKTDRYGNQPDNHNVELTQTIFGATPDLDVVIKLYATIQNSRLASATQIGYLQSALNGLMTTAFVSDLRGWQS